MLTRLRGALTYANVMATVAVFLALGGGAYAVTTLAPNSVRSKHIVNGQVRRPDIAANAINSFKVANGKLLAADFAAGQLPRGASATATTDPNPDTTLSEGTVPMVSTSITTHAASRIVATASANVVGSSADVYCVVEVGRGGSFTTVGGGPHATFASANQRIALPVVGTVKKPAGTYTVRVACGGGAGPKFTDGNLAAIAVP
jgi:hypothetical protein